MKSAFYEVIDIVLIEMSNRFMKEDAILNAIDTADEMDLEKLRPLTELGIVLPSQIELTIAKEFIDGIRKENDEINKKKKSGEKKLKRMY